MFNQKFGDVVTELPFNIGSLGDVARGLVEATRLSVGVVGLDLELSRQW
jgi:hypothetical protein